MIYTLTLNPALDYTIKLENLNYVIRKFKLRRTDYSLKSTDRTRPGCSRTGITIQSRYTDGLCIPSVNLSFKEVRQMDIGKNRCHGLNPSPKARQKL